MRLFIFNNFVVFTYLTQMGVFVVKMMVRAFLSNLKEIGYTYQLVTKRSNHVIINPGLVIKHVLQLFNLQRLVGCSHKSCSKSCL